MQYKFKKASGVLQQNPIDNKDEILLGRLGRVHSLSGVAIDIWNMLDEPKSIEDIYIIISNLFHVDFEKAKLDCEYVLNFLIQEKLVVNAD